MLNSTDPLELAGELGEAFAVTVRLADEIDVHELMRQIHPDVVVGTLPSSVAATDVGQFEDLVNAVAVDAGLVPDDVYACDSLHVALVTQVTGGLVFVEINGFGLVDPEALATLSIDAEVVAVYTNPEVYTQVFHARAGAVVATYDIGLDEATGAWPSIGADTWGQLSAVDWEPRLVEYICSWTGAEPWTNDKTVLAMWPHTTFTEPDEGRPDAARLLPLSSRRAVHEALAPLVDDAVTRPDVAELPLLTAAIDLARTFWASAETPHPTDEEARAVADLEAALWARLEEEPDDTQPTGAIARWQTMTLEIALHWLCASHSDQPGKLADQIASVARYNLADTDLWSAHRDHVEATLLRHPRKLGAVRLEDDRLLDTTYLGTGGDVDPGDLDLPPDLEERLRQWLGGPLGDRPRSDEKQLLIDLVPALSHLMFERDSRAVDELREEEVRRQVSQMRSSPLGVPSPFAPRLGQDDVYRQITRIMSTPPGVD